MRELKLRAWDKDNDQMIYHFGLTPIDYFPYQLPGPDCESPEDPGNYSYFDNVELMQYIGVTDKNGVEIAEGDIVLTPYGRYKWNANEEEDESRVLDMIPSRVIQNTMGWALIPEMGKKKALQRIKRRRYMFPTHYSKSEVIGNIYENPELLA